MPNPFGRAFRPWALLLCILPALAQQTASGPAYIVEMVIFRTSNVGASEDWSTAPVARGFGNDSGKAGPVAQLSRVLPPTDYRLTGLETTLRGSGAWRPLAHAAWMQTAGVWGNAHAGLSLSDLGVDVPGLTGTIYVERGQYLHLGFNVSYTNGGPTYVIDEMRSIKLGDKLYFDHPAFGIIATVSPVRR
jgi:hypothetical protein